MMARRIVRALRLPLERKILFTRVSCMLLAVRLGLSLFSFARVYRFLKRFHPAGERAALRPSGAADAAAACWAVTRAGKLWFGDQGCLPSALVGELLLLRIGVPARLQIGIRKDRSGELLAHAWVESNEGVLIGGGSSLSRGEFQHLPEIQRVIERQQGRA